MKKRGVLLLLLILLPNALAYQVKIILTDQNSNLLEDHLALVEYQDLQEERYLGEDSSLLLDIRESSLIRISIRSLADKSRFYHVEKNLNINSDMEITLQAMPVAHIVGIVVDEYDNLVINADLKFQCTAFELLTKTDSVGSFRVVNMPMGRCRIFASSKSSAGFIDLDINENKLYPVEVKMDKKRKGSEFPFITALGILVLLVLILLIFKLGRSGAPLPTSQKPMKRMDDLMKTLNENERAVVDYLLKKDGSATQTAIRQFTGIPKTSLFRCVNSLEKRKIVSTESIGKMKKVKLTDFFLKT